MHCDAGTPNWKYIFLDFHFAGPASQCIYSGPKRPADDWIDRHKIKKGPQTTLWMDGQTY